MQSKIQSKSRTDRPKMKKAAMLGAILYLTLQAGSVRAAAPSDTMTIQDVHALAPLVATYSADDAITGIVIAGRLRGEGAFASDQAYAALLRLFRYQVKGLAMSLQQVPGMSFVRCPHSDTLWMFFDSQGVRYQDIEIVFSTDDWATSQTVTFEKGLFGTWIAAGDSLPPDGRFSYALHLWGTDGRDFWLNYSFNLPAASGLRLRPTAPAFVQLLRTFQDPDSPAGTTISNDEFSILVEEMTWEGGYAVHDPKVVRPIMAELDSLAAAGADFEPGLLENMRRFCQNQLDLFPWATYPSAMFDRTDEGSLTMRIHEPGANGARLYYSTDGWNNPKTAECALVNDGLPTCDLGHIPPGAVLSYSILIFTNDGDRWIHAFPNNNFFQEIDD